MSWNLSVAVSPSRHARYDAPWHAFLPNIVDFRQRLTMRLPKPGGNKPDASFGGFKNMEYQVQSGLQPLGKSQFYSVRVTLANVPARAFCVFVLQTIARLHPKQSEKMVKAQWCSVQTNVVGVAWLFTRGDVATITIPIEHEMRSKPILTRQLKLSW